MAYYSLQIIIKGKLQNFPQRLRVVILAKDLQSPKAQSPMALTELGIVMLCKDSQPEKAPSPVALTELGIVMLSKDLQSARQSPQWPSQTPGL